MNAGILQYTPLASANRLRIIVTVLVKHGFGELVDRLGLRRRSLFRRLPIPEPRTMTVWEKLRLVMEELGPTTIKIGQILSMRPDMIPPDLSEELKKLQENLPPVPFPVIEKTLVAAYGRPLAQLFTDFERTPVATASLSQVHRAKRADDGRLVAVKVRLPQVVETLAADLDILEFIAGLVEEHMPSLRPDRPREVVRELRKNIMREIDFSNEAVNMQLFNDFFATEPDVFAPAVHGDMVRQDVLVMDFIHGERLDEFQGSEEQRERLAKLGFMAAVRQVLEKGLFHADPHLGNLRVVDGTKLCYLDFGMCGRLNASIRSSIVDFIISLGQDDPAKTARTLLEASVSYPPEIDALAFESDVMYAMHKTKVPFREGFLGRFMLDLTMVCRDYRVRLRPDFMLMARALLATESAGRTLYPKLDAMKSLAELGQGYALRRLIPGLSDKPLFGDVEEMVRSIAKMPGQLSAVLRRLESGEISLDMRQREWGAMPSNLRRIGNRLGGALLTAALVVGSSLVYTSGLGPRMWDMPVIGLLGFALSGLLGLYVAFKMFRDT